MSLALTLLALLLVVSIVPSISAGFLPPSRATMTSILSPSSTSRRSPSSLASSSRRRRRSSSLPLLARRRTGETSDVFLDRRDGIPSVLVLRR